MNRAQIEERFSSLRAQRESGTLDEATFRVEVAKLLVRSREGALWLIDADSGAWLCNRGSGWVEEMPPEDFEPQPVPAAPRQDGQGRLARWAAGGLAVVLVLSVALIVILRLGLLDAWLPWGGGEQAPTITVTIASPADASQAALGRGMAIESTLAGFPDLGAVDRVELRVNGQTVDTQAIQPKAQPGEVSLPLSQPWRPEATGEHQLSVVALSASGETLGAASITIRVTEVGGTAQTALTCSADAVLVHDVTIPADTVFPPNTRLEKVWQVRNSGTCAWGVGYSLLLTEGKGLQAVSPGPVPPTAAGESAEIAVTFQTPAEPGSYVSQWRLQGPDGEPFGAALALSIRVEVQVRESPQPPAPGDLRAVLTEDGQAIRLTWEDRSDNESGFRVYRADVEPSIGLAAADATEFVDGNVACGNAYRYTVVAFTAAKRSEPSEPVSVTMPACSATGVPRATPIETPTPRLSTTPAVQPAATPSLVPSPTQLAILVDLPPTLTLAISPTAILAGEAFTITFAAGDDLAVDRVLLWGVQSGVPELNLGRFFSCAVTPCVGSWRVTGTLSMTETWTLAISETWTVAGFAIDMSGQNSEPAMATVLVRPRE